MNGPPAAANVRTGQTEGIRQMPVYQGSPIPATGARSNPFQDAARALLNAGYDPDLPIAGRPADSTSRGDRYAHSRPGLKHDPNAVARSCANAAADPFRPPDQMRSPRPATGSRAKRKHHLNVADNTRSEEQPQSETADLRLAEALEAVASHPRQSRELRSKRRGRHSEDAE
jgi:hypothetical protein